MQGSYGIVYPLWSHDAGGELLDRAIGEVGLTHITIPAVSGAARAFRAWSSSPPKVFHTDGGWHYPPDLARYRSSSVRPRPAGWFGKRNVLARVCEDAQRRGVQVVFRIDMRRIPAWLAHAPQILQRNAWGDEMPGLACCLNAEWRELLADTLDDLSAYGPAGYEILSWRVDEPAEDKPVAGAAFKADAQRLLSMCFCPSCRQAATASGVDAEQAARSATVHIQRDLSRPASSAATVLDTDEALAAYTRARQQDAAGWLAQVAALRPAARHFAAVFADRRVPDGLHPLLYPGIDTPDLAREEALDHLWPAGAGGGLACAAWWPAFAHSEEVVRFVAAIRDRGADFFDFERLDEAPETALDWLRQAVRYAHRE